MSLSLDENNAIYQVKAYQPGQIQIMTQVFDHSIIVSGDKLQPLWRPQTLAELQIADFELILAWQPTILLIGTGSRLQFPPLTTYGHLINAGIGVEVMDTRAACRTYNALISENRKVAAALIIR